MKPDVTVTGEEKQPVAAPRPNWKRYLVVRLVGLVVFTLGIWTVPHMWCMREADRWYAGDTELQGQLGRGVERWLEQELQTAQFRTPTEQLSGEWLYGTYMMAAMGFGQSALEHPEWREKHSELMGKCLDLLISEKVRAFDTASWQGQDALKTLEDAQGHAAYLGYLNLALGLHRKLVPDSRHAALNDRITAALVKRVKASPTMLLRTYPAETYPVDNCAVIGSIGIHGDATGRDYRQLLLAWEKKCRGQFIDPKCGLLYQAVDRRTGKRQDHARGSGTTLAIYFLSYSHPELSADLYAAVKKQLAGTFLGFGAVREYPPGSSGSSGDIDSGPIVMGYGVSATGFCLAGSRIHGDPDYFARLYASAYLAGAPLDREDRRGFVTGGPLGNAILFAMLTARPMKKVSKP